ncbi:MAG: YidC/Oxa1 family membrane protein insertase, partial [Candidatus Omnitrophica bacterium]|nr:YidC/Oxa1 family membrane protein insertase [Candidatus Omnitrophota bacterium]
MDKKLFQAVTLTLIFFLLYTFIGKKYFPQEKTIKDLNTSTENITNTQENLEISVLPEYIEENIEQDLPNHIFGNLYVTYSPKGGYINSIAINDEDNILPFKNIGLIPDEKEKDFSVKIEHNRLIFNNSNNEKKIFIFDDNIVTVIISPENKSQIILVSNHLSSKMIEQRYQEIFYHKDNQIKRIQPKKVKETSYQNVKFIGARERYYCFSLLEGDYNLDLKRNKDAVYFYLDSQVKQLSFYIGPQTEKKLKQFNLQGIMHYGFFHSIGVLMVKILYFFHSFTKNWGISLIIFSFFIYSILLPFTMKSTNAMRQMQQIQPLMNELKEKYKDNP